MPIGLGYTALGALTKIGCLHHHIHRTICLTPYYKRRKPALAFLFLNCMLTLPTVQKDKLPRNFSISNPCPFIRFRVGLEQTHFEELDIRLLCVVML